jgi:hypothetical protein
VVFERGTIRERTGGAVIATHLPHCWSVEGAEFLRLDVEPEVVVTRENFALSTTGHLSSVDGIAYIDRRVFAVVERPIKRGSMFGNVRSMRYCVRSMTSCS